MLIVSDFPKGLSLIKNPTINVQLEAVRKSNYNILIFEDCPDWEQIKEQVYNEMLAKSIIE